MSSAGVEAMHACLSSQIVDDLLRKKMRFDGVVISECLELDALKNNMGVSGGTVMAVNAGCDIILVCHTSTGQQEAFKGLKTGFGKRRCHKGKDPAVVQSCASDEGEILELGEDAFSRWYWCTGNGTAFAC